MIVLLAVPRRVVIAMIVMTGMTVMIVMIVTTSRSSVLQIMFRPSF